MNRTSEACPLNMFSSCARLRVGRWGWRSILMGWPSDRWWPPGGRAGGRPPSQQQPSSSKMDTPECPVGGPAVHNRLHGIDHAVRVAAQHACLLPESAVAKCAQPFDRKRHAGRSAMRRLEKSQAACGGDASLRRRPRSKSVFRDASQHRYRS